MKNIISIVWKVTLSCMLILSLIIIPSSTELKAQETKVYVALGDSITTGYRLNSKDTESFPALLANANGWELHNLAKDGATTSHLLEVINDPSNETLLKEADYITITIGGNDLMDALYQFLTDKWNETYPDDKITLEDMKTGLATNGSYQIFAFLHLDEFNESEQEKSALATIASNLSDIDTALSGKINTKIVIATQYNPYQFEKEGMISTLNRYFSKEIEELNKLIDSSNLQHMQIAPVAEKFAASTVNLCNASSTPLELDFHPNAAGHRVIYQTILDTLGITTYPLTVPNGTGSGEYAAGVPINVSANAPSSGQHFKTWTSTNGGIFKDSNKSETTFTMPANDTTITATYENHIAEADDGDCTTPILCSVCKEIMTPAQSAHSFGEWKSNGDGTHTKQCQHANCTQKETENCSGGTATYFEQAICSICHSPYGSLLTDSTKPTGSIQIDTMSWTQFDESISFDQFYKDTVQIEITAQDDSYEQGGYTPEKAVKIEYYLYEGTQPLTQAQLATKTFTTYTKAIELSGNHTYILYAKLTDHAGNVTYLNTTGIVMDQTAPQLSGITNGSTYCSAKEVTLSDNYDQMNQNVLSATINGEPVTIQNGKFTIEPAEGIQTIVITDTAGNTATYKVTVNQGHTFTNYVSNQDATCEKDGTETAICDFCQETDTRILQNSALAHAYVSPVWDWASDYSTCKVSFTCAHDASHVLTLDAQVTKKTKTPATCTEKGITTYTASIEWNHVVYTDEAEQADIPMVEHETQLLKSKEATCTQEGYTGDEICKNCRTILKTGSILPKLSHVYENGECIYCHAKERAFNENTNEEEPVTSMDPSVSNNDPAISEKDPSNANTGVDSSALLWGALLLIAGISLSGMVYGQYKKR